MAAGVVTRANVGDRRLAALSFDDGPADATEGVLDLLAAQGVQATFFVLGRQIAGRERTLRRAVTEGHELGNHGWSHASASELAETALQDELARTSAAIQAETGIHPRLARPPYGADAEMFAAAAAAEGLAPTVLWSVDPEDWRPDADPNALARHVLDSLHPGAIVDLHDGWGRTPSARGPTLDALALVLPVLADSGWTLLTVSGLLAASTS